MQSTSPNELTDGLHPVSVLGHHAKGSLEVVVHLVDVLVDATMVQQLVHKEVPSVLQRQTAEQLTQHHIPGGKGGRGEGRGGERRRRKGENERENGEGLERELLDTKYLMAHCDEPNLKGGLAYHFGIRSYSYGVFII